MQIQTKLQLKIELDNSDMLQAVNDYLNKHGQRITAEELQEVKFVNSVKDGLRANINITEDTVTDTDTDGINTDADKAVIGEVTVEVQPVSELQTAATEHAKAKIEEVDLTVVEPTPEVEVEPVEPIEAVEPGAVEPSTEDDVMSLDDIKAIVESNDVAAASAPVAVEEDEPVPTAEEAPRKNNLFL